MNFCHGAHCTIRGLCYMTPRPALVFLFLLFLNKPCLGCNFNQSPISSMFDDKIEKLLKYLPQDYNVSIISNLKPHSHCSHLWMIYFIRKELVRIEGLSGETLKEQVLDLRQEVEFIDADCHFNVSEDCRMEKKNVIDFLNITSSTMRSMKTDHKIINNFSNCTAILCKKDASGNYTTQQQTHNTTFLQPNDKDLQIGKEQHSRKHVVSIGVTVILFSIVLFLFLQLCCKKNTEQNGTEESSERQG